MIANTEAATSLLAKRGHFVVDDTIGVSLLFAGIFNKKPGKYLLVANNLYGAQKIADFLSSLIGEENVFLFPVDDLLRNELRVLLTRGVNGLYIYACDKNLRDHLKKCVR